MKIHIVKKGDTMYELAKKHQIELDEIIALNPQIADPNYLTIGEKVKLPSRPKPVEPPASEYVYKHIVQQGDSLWKLGKAWDVPLHAMIQANPQLKNPNVLMTGEVVYVPKAHDEQSQHKPLPGHPYKPSTAPFVQPPVVQPAAPSATVEQSIMPIVEGPVHEKMPTMTEGIVHAPTYTPTPVPEQPSWNMPLETETEPVAPTPEKGELGLSESYTAPTVHPFKQFHIKATEVIAFPVEDQAEISKYPEFSPYPQTPWEHGHYPVDSGQFPVSDGGCGCGEAPSAEQPWSSFPASTPSFPAGMSSFPESTPSFPAGMPSFPISTPSYTAEEPWQGFPQGMPPMPGYYPQVPVPMVSPYDMQQVPCFPFGPELHAPYHGMMSHYGMPYPTPYESTILPQVHTHQLTEVTDKEATLDIDTRSGKEKAVKINSGSSKKSKSSNTATVNEFLKKQQNQSEKSNPKPNLPWINV